MNEKKIISFLMSKIIEKTQKGLENIEGPLVLDVDILKVCFKDIKYYAKMIIED